MEIKIAKFSDDPCFGKKHEQIEQCNYCWLKGSCLVCFRNRKD